MKGRNSEEKMQAHTQACTPGGTDELEATIREWQEKAAETTEAARDSQRLTDEDFSIRINTRS